MTFQVGHTFGNRFKPGQSGNPSGRPKKIMRDALLHVVDEETARDLAHAQMMRAKEGDTAAFREIADRLDGKVEQNTTQLNVNASYEFYAWLKAPEMQGRAQALIGPDLNLSPITPESSDSANSLPTDDAEKP